MLKDLNGVANDSRQRYIEEFQPGDIILSDEFEHEFSALLRSNSANVIFYQYTSEVTSSGNKKIFVPNQWYVVAAYMVGYVHELLAYKEHLEKIFDADGFSKKEREDFIRDMKSSSSLEKEIEFREKCCAYFASVNSDTIDQDSDCIVKFVTNYDWWFGSKTIDRGDFYVSPVLGLLGVVNASQGYIADICMYYTMNTQLLETAKELAENQVLRNLQVVQMSLTSSSTAAPRLTGGKNLIVYGAPGTGKSRYLEDNFGDSLSKRVVFHPEYTYFDFVGSYKPVPLYKQGIELVTSYGEAFQKGEPYIDYQYVPGPFIEVFIEACLNPDKMHTLLLEEINRANAASVFGEIFQLLDRFPDGRGEYTVNPPTDLNNYLKGSEAMAPFISSGISIPSNMNIVATMNSADQGVNILDAAFKRRWEFKYIKVSVEGCVHEKAVFKYSGANVYWGDFVSAVNNKLKELRIDEDRLIGPYFIRPEEVGKSSAMDKLLLYLWDDVVRHRRDQFFDSDIRTFSDLVESFSARDVLQLPEYLDLQPAINEIGTVGSSEETEAEEFSDGEE